MYMPFMQPIPEINRAQEVSNLAATLRLERRRLSVIHRVVQPIIKPRHAAQWLVGELHIAMHECIRIAPRSINSEGKMAHSDWPRLFIQRTNWLFFEHSSEPMSVDK
jgi:hypothetical protein